MTETKINEQAEAFIALSRKERREQYDALPEEVQNKVRPVIESRRGIAKRDGGKIVHTQEVYITQILRMAAKERDLKKRLAKLPQRMATLKARLQAHYGDEALAKAEQQVASFMAEVEPTNEQ